MSNPINSINSTNQENTKYFLITIDVEDWFQVENFKPWIPFETWDDRELRVEKNTHKLLNLFDSIVLPVQPANSKNSTNLHPVKFFEKDSEADLTGATNSRDPINHIPTRNPQPATRNIKNTPKATFFILGWIAKKLPHLVREIHARGHEVASHGLNHELPGKMPLEEFKKDLVASKKLLEEIAGVPVYGYRAPSFAISDDILKIIEEAGYRYDSSYNSFGMHGRYGNISLNGNVRTGAAYRISETFYELPISNLQIGGRTFPVGGGGYFRLIPRSIFKMGINRILENGSAYTFYLHPWELDPEQPRVGKASLQYRFRHYSNLSRTHGKLKKLIGAFSQCRFSTCSQYLSELV